MSRRCQQRRDYRARDMPGIRRPQEFTGNSGRCRTAMYELIAAMFCPSRPEYRASPRSGQVTPRVMCHYAWRGETWRIVGESGRTVTALALMRLIEQSGANVPRRMLLRRRVIAAVSVGSALPRDRHIADRPRSTRHLPLALNCRIYRQQAPSPKRRWRKKRMLDQYGSWSRGKHFIAPSASAFRRMRRSGQRSRYAILPSGGIDCR
ncbi:hypothetical protein KCP78_02940 [Salmonella enterica subsp. enterica]|nr:hypothetical protein KCP78_02940 [Salmonella enterica subsp. enterica]